MKTQSTKSKAPVILCGTDFSPSAAQAADVACVLAKALHAPLELAHVCVIPAFPELGKVLGREANRLRQEGAVVHELLLDGNADEELVKRATPKSCQLVVVSSLGKRAVGRWLLGSVSERTAERSAVPTLVVRDAAPFEAWTRGERPLKVFVAFNFTATSEAALLWVKTLQAIGPCEVVVGYVDWPPEQRARLGGTGPLSLVGNPPEMQGILDRELGARVKELLGSNDIRTCVEANWGRPDAALAGMAKKERADLVVVGSHQYRGFERIWKTSISSGLLHAAAMSVAVVPMTTKKSQSPGIAPPMRRILVSTDFSSLANHAIPQAYALLQGGGTVHLVHVVHPHELTGGEYHQGPANPGFRKKHAKHVQDCESKLTALIPAEAASHGISTEIEVVDQSDTAKGICQAAERFGADAICSGSHGLSGLSTVLLGSVAQKVLALSSRPLLLVRPPADA